MKERFEELAIKYNLITEGMVGSFYMDALNKFAEELIEHEREACAKVCEMSEPEFSDFENYYYAFSACASAIRARGEVK